MAGSQDQPCPIEGNSDLYGLGVRLGLYLQFIALVLARPSARHAFDALSASTIAFILSNFIVLAQQSVTRALLAPEAYLLFYLLAPQLAVNVLGTDFHAATISYIGFVTMLLWGAFCFYFSWFWWVGLDVLNRSGCEDEFGFFFTRVSLRGWFRTFNKVVWTMANISYGISFLRLLASYACWLLRVIHLLRKGRESETDTDQPHSSPSPTRTGHRTNLTPIPDKEILILGNIIQHVIVQFWSLIPFAICVSGAEVTLWYNDIQNVNTVDTASQLIPLVFALGLLVHVVSRTSMKLRHGFLHAFDEVHTDEVDDDSHDPTRDELRQRLREERGRLGGIGRLLFRVYCGLVEGYSQTEDESEDEGEGPGQSGSATGCPENGRNVAADVQL
ncbi:hypothetical protein GGR52DRAFT_5982 [Hypoxylon sp. FL1284]|nr:hypothetical protein GGR52DRAFT_5982 [Hypoxylon sp. FL1284]